MSRRHHPGRNLVVLGIALLVAVAWWPSRPAAQQQNPSAFLSPDFENLTGNAPSSTAATLVVPASARTPAIDDPPRIPRLCGR